MKWSRSGKVVALALALGGAGGSWVAAGNTLRIVSYNIDCADQSSDLNITGAAHSLPTVLDGIGRHHLGTNAQPMDVMNCEELQSTSLGNFVTELNAIYGAGTYAYDLTTDPNTGGGPDGLIYNTHTVQVVSARALITGETVLLQANGTYVSAHSPGGGNNGVARAPMVYQLRPLGFGPNDDFYMYVSHARSTSDDSAGDARYAEAQEVRSDAKYKLPAGVHILYAGDWNLFNGSGENAYKCLTGQTTSDGVNWADTSSIWGNTNQTQGYDPTSKTSPPTTTTFANVASDNALWLYDDSTDAGTYAMNSRLDIQLPNALMYGAYNPKGGVQLTPDISDPYDTSGSTGFPSSKYHYAFEVFGNNGTTPEGGVATAASNHSLDDLTNTVPNLLNSVPNEATVKTDLQETLGGSSFVGSDHYPIFGDYIIVVAQPPVAGFSATPTNGVAPLTVAFTDAATGAITNWVWNFGDGTTNAYTTTNATHIYTNAGVYTVTETVTGPGGSNVFALSNLITVLTSFQGWQVFYFGSTNAAQAQPAADADGTGQNNLFKYEAGLNPTNAASVFVFNVASVPGSPAGASLVFSPVVAGRRYTPLFSTNLLNGPWVPLTTGAIPVTNGSQVTITDTNAIRSQGFYQIQISNP